MDLDMDFAPRTLSKLLQRPPELLLGCDAPAAADASGAAAAAARHNHQHQQQQQQQQPPQVASVTHFIQHAFGWNDSQNMQVLFPSLPDMLLGGTAAQQQQQQQQDGMGLAVLQPLDSVLSPVGSGMPASKVSGPVLVSPFASLRPDFLTARQQGAAAAAAAAGHQQHKQHQHHQQQHQHPAHTNNAGSSGSSGNAGPPGASPEQQQQLLLHHQQQCMLLAQQELMQRQAQLLKRQREHQQQAAAAAAAATNHQAGGSEQKQLLDFSAPSPFQQQQQQQQLQARQQLKAAQLQQQPKGGTRGTAPGAAAAAAAANASKAREQQQQQVGAAAAAAPQPRRRGRPPKADGQYSEAYLALKRYRARKKNEVQEMEAELAAKLEQLQQLQHENRALRDKHDALEHTLEAQDRIVHELSAMRLKSPNNSGGVGSAGTAAAAAAAAATAAAAEAEAARESGGSPGGSPGLQQQQQQQASAGREGDALWCRTQQQLAASAAASALVAAVTGEQEGEQKGGGHGGPGGPSGTGGAAAAAAAAASAAPLDWAAIRPAPSGQAHPLLVMHGRQPQELAYEETLDVAVLLDRYKSYVAGAAAALARLAAAALPGAGGAQQQHQPKQEPHAQQQVPLAAVGQFTCEQASALGVVLPPWPWTLAEYLAMGNDERIPPSLPACNLLTGAYESIEPEIWRTVASQVQLRPWQVGKLTAAWQLYAAALDQITHKRLALLERLKGALHPAAAAAAVAAAQQQRRRKGCSGGGGARAAAAGTAVAAAAAAPAADGDDDAAWFAVDSSDGSELDLRLPSGLTFRQLDDLLSHDEYWELCEAINANLAREDSIMILFDYAIGNMLDELQLAIICVASWPFMPLLGCICRWLVGPAVAEAGGGEGGDAGEAEMGGA